MRMARPSRRARPRLIREPTHPSYDPEAGQCGLFASRPLARGAWVLDYVGEVSAGGCEDRDSDYVSDFGERAELALDADKVGDGPKEIDGDMHMQGLQRTAAGPSTSPTSKQARTDTRTHARTRSLPPPRCTLARTHTFPGGQRGALR